MSNMQSIGIDKADGSKEPPEPKFSSPSNRTMVTDEEHLATELPVSPTGSDGSNLKKSNNKLSDSHQAMLCTPERTEPSSSTPLEVLDQEIRNFFDGGIQAATSRCVALRVAILRGETVVNLRTRSSLSRNMTLPMPAVWNISYLAATIVLLFASPPDPKATLAALRWLSVQLGGLPTMVDIWKNASADLPKRFAQAKKAAIDGKVAKVTVLGVNLVDVEIIDRGEIKSRDMDYTSFAHSFALAIGREGFRVYQAWQTRGLRFDQYLMNGGSRLRSWAESKSFLRNFKILSRPQKKWSPELNSAYAECFEVNIDLICGEGHMNPPIIPVYRPWVRVFEINEVKIEDIKKFKWEGSV